MDARRGAPPREHAVLVDPDLEISMGSPAQGSCTETVGIATRLNGSVNASVSDERRADRSGAQGVVGSTSPSTSRTVPQWPRLSPAATLASNRRPAIPTRSRRSVAVSRPGRRGAGFRGVICSTNTIEWINARYRRAVKAHGRFLTEQAAIKFLYLVTRSLEPTGKGRARWRCAGSRPRTPSPSPSPDESCPPTPTSRHDRLHRSSDSPAASPAASLRAPRCGR
jgi:hypothetical protein